MYLISRTACEWRCTAKQCSRGRVPGPIKGMTVHAIRLQRGRARSHAFRKGRLLVKLRMDSRRPLYNPEAKKHPIPSTEKLYNSQLWSVSLAGLFKTHGLLNSSLPFLHNARSKLGWLRRASEHGGGILQAVGCVLLSCVKNGFGVRLREIGGASAGIVTPEATATTSDACLRALVASAVFFETLDPSSPGRSKVAIAIATVSNGQVSWRSRRNNAAARGLFTLVLEPREKELVITLA